MAAHPKSRSLAAALAWIAAGLLWVAAAAPALAVDPGGTRQGTSQRSSQGDIHTRIQALLQAGDAAAALREAEAAARDQPEDARLHFVQGVALMDLGRDGQALAVFEALLQHWPELPDPLNNIGLLHARAGRLDAAREALLAALRNEPTHRAARINLGHVHLMLAVRDWEQAASAAPLEAALQRRLQAARALLGEGPAPR
jgi:Flp pilus assembly protein TadD